MAKYIGKRIVPVHCGVWEQNRSYEMLSIVLDESSGDSYISRRAVPSGTALRDTTYWMLHSLYSQQIQDMADHVTAAEARISQTAANMSNEVTAAKDAMNRQKAAFDETAQTLNTRMDTVLAAGTGAGDTEILDARVDADGVTHDSLGTAVRTGDLNVKAEMNNRMDGITEATRNSWTFGDQEFTQFKIFVCDPPLPAGTYTFSSMITSEDTDTDICRVAFYRDPDKSHRIGSSNQIYASHVGRNARIHFTFTSEDAIELILLNASNTVANSEGDKAVYTDIQLEAGSKETDHIHGESAVDANLRERFASQVAEDERAHEALKSLINAQGDELNARISEVTEETRNLWKFGRQEFTQFKICVCDPPLPAGKYTFSAVITSDDTDASVSRVAFYKDPEKKRTVGSANLLYAHNLRRGERVSVSFEVEEAIELILMDASVSVELSEGDSAVFDQVQLEAGDTLSAYIPNESASDYVARESLSSIPSDYLPSTNDETDRTAEIQSMLTSRGVCRLGIGVFYVNGIKMPEDTAIIGSGASTKVILAGDGHAIRMNSRCLVESMSILGSEEDIDLSDSLENRHGILWLGGGNGNNPERGTVSNCWIAHFSGGGITCTDSGYGTEAGMNVMNCQIYNCNAGVNITHWSEYHRFTNVNMNHCYYGCINNGGNNVFANCGFSSNTLGMFLDNENDKSRNNTHGSAVGCVFNHTDGNAGTAIKIVNCHAGFVFDGCQLFYGKIEVIESSRMMFTHFNCGKQVEIIINGGNLSLFDGCLFRDDLVVTITGNNKVRFSGCYDNGGNVIDPTA